MLDGGVIEPAAKAVQDFEFRPDRGRLLGAFARTDNFERLQLLPLLLKNTDDVGGRTRA